MQCVWLVWDRGARKGGAFVWCGGGGAHIINGIGQRVALAIISEAKARKFNAAGCNCVRVGGWGVQDQSMLLGSYLGHFPANLPRGFLNRVQAAVCIVCQVLHGVHVSGLAQRGGESMFGAYWSKNWPKKETTPLNGAERPSSGATDRAS